MSKKAVVVTGAASGIGAAVFTDLSRSGYAVVGIDRSTAPDSLPAQCAWVVGDVSDASSIDEAIREAQSLGTLVAWVNNAGVVEDVPLHLISEERIDETLNTNLRGTLLGTRAALREFLRAGTAGSIVNIGSIHGRGAFPGTPAYDSTKGAIEAITRYTATEYGHLGIRANTIAPGAIRTEMLASAIAAAPDPEGLERDYSALHPMDRLGESSEVASVVRFLLSADASFVSGATIPVDGGAASRVFAFPPHKDVPRTLSGP